MNKEEITNWFKDLQDDICRQLEAADGKALFEEDNWVREGGGGGRSRIIRNGNIIEKGGVNFSAVYGTMPDKILNALQLEKADFYATGISIVIHTQNPWCPIVHMNTRYFEMSNGNKWFGGGIDLTPHYVIKDDAHFFHQTLKDVCDKHDPSYYPEFKKWADDYFFIKHRNETRGIGGIFFDRMQETDKISLAARFDYVKDVGRAFAPTYISILNRNKERPFGDAEKKWQLVRRGRYVEFNLIYDNGTKFGLDTNGRAESILMSMPPVANWEYNYIPDSKTLESETLRLLKKDIDWI